MSRVQDAMNRGELSPLAYCEDFPAYMSPEDIVRNNREDDIDIIIDTCNNQMIEWLKDFYKRNPATIVYACGHLKNHQETMLLGKIIFSYDGKIVIQDNPIREHNSEFYARLGYMEDYDIHDTSVELQEDMEDCLWIGGELEYISGFFVYNPSTKNIHKIAMLERLN